MRQVPGFTPAAPAAPLDHVDTVLPTGLRVVALRKRTVPMVEVRLSVPFARGEGVAAGDWIARADVLAATVLAGAGGRTRQQVDQALAAIGARVGAGVGPEHLGVSGSALREHLPELLGLLAQVVADARFPEDEVRREKERLLDRLAVQQAQPAVTARRALLRHAFGEHPFGRPDPEPGEVRAVGRAEVAALRDRALVPSGAVLVLVGDVGPDRLVAAAAAAFAGWVAEVPARALWPHDPVGPTPRVLVDNPGAAQSQLRLIADGVPRADPGYAAAKLANLVFGGYFSSRLMGNLREDKGYTYGASSGLDTTVAGSTVMVSLDSARETTAAALGETLRELDRMAAQPPSVAEVEAVRQFALGSLPLSVASQSGLAGTVARLLALGLDLGWIDRYREDLAAVTVAQVRQAGAGLFAPDRFRGVVQGDAAALAADLAPLGWSP